MHKDIIEILNLLKNLSDRYEGFENYPEEFINEAIEVMGCADRHVYDFDWKAYYADKRQGEIEANQDCRGER